MVRYFIRYSYINSLSILKYIQNSKFEALQYKNMALSIPRVSFLLGSLVLLVCGLAVSVNAGHRLKMSLSLKCILRLHNIWVSNSMALIIQSGTETTSILPVVLPVNKEVRIYCLLYNKQYGSFDYFGFVYELRIRWSFLER